MALIVFGNTFEIEKKPLLAAAREVFSYLEEDFEVNFRFVSEANVRKLNKVYRKKDKVSDVLSFKLDPEEDGGDVVICYKEMAREAKAWGMKPQDVTAFLLVHGMLHLADYDHTTAPERVKMEKAEEAILGKLKITLER